MLNAKTLQDSRAAKMSDCTRALLSWNAAARMVDPALGAGGTVLPPTAVPGTTATRSALRISHSREGIFMHAILVVRFAGH